MKLTRQLISSSLLKITLPGEGKPVASAITNINIFGQEIVLDITISNPTLQARKKVESEIKNTLIKAFGDDLTVVVNILVEAPKVSNPNMIKGKAIPGIQHIVAIASGKGGVGKSTVTANLAISLVNMGFKVGILDADIYGPSIPIMFDVSHEKPLAVNVDGKSKMQPVENYGVKILSIGFFTQPDQAVIWRGPMAAKALNQMIFDANWGTLDFLLIDLPPGTGDIHLSIMQSLPITGSVIVSTPQAVALADAKKGVAMFRQQNIDVPVLGVVENMAYFSPNELPDNKYYIFGKSGAKYLAQDLDIPFLGELPLVQSIREAGDVGRPAALQTDNKVVQSYRKLTQEMVSELVKRNQNLPPTDAIKITTMAGCSAVNNKNDRS